MSTFSLYSDKAQAISGFPSRHTTVTNAGPSTAYYKAAADVGSGDTALTKGSSVTITEGTRWFISSATSRLFVSHSPEATTDLATQAELDTVSTTATAAATKTELTTHGEDSTEVHGIANTANLGTKAEIEAVDTQLDNLAIINVKDEGAKGDGTTDDTEAFKSAKDAAGVGGEIHVPDGTYIVNSLILDKEGQTWKLGRAVLKLPKETANPVFRVHAAGTTFLGGEFDGNRAENVGKSSTGVILIRASRAKILNAYIRDTDYAGIHLAPLAVGTAVNDTQIRGCSFVNTNIGIFLNWTGATVPSYGVVIDGCWVEATEETSGSGISVYGAVAGRLHGVSISNCFVTMGIGANNEAIHPRYCDGVTVANCHIEGSDLGITCDQNTALAVVGCSARNADQYGIECNNNDRVSISGCTVDGEANTEAGIIVNSSQDVAVDGCTITNLLAVDNSGAGIIVTENESKPERVTISGNTLNFTRRGIYINKNCLDVAVTGNLIFGDTTAELTRTGIEVRPVAGGSKRISITGNSFLNCTNYTVGLFKEGGETETAEDLWVKGNTSIDSKSPEVLVEGTIAIDSTSRFDMPQTIASANTMALKGCPSFVKVTGTTEIKKITATYDGHVVTLKFAEAVTVTDGENLKLNGNFAAPAEGSLTLVCDGTNWWEVARSGPAASLEIDGDLNHDGTKVGVFGIAPATRPEVKKEALTANELATALATMGIVKVEA